jgi:branched-chain amino acid transport system ATP-binding protein
MLAIARCLMSAPQLIMFHEPSLGLAPAIVHKLLETICELNQDGGIAVSRLRHGIVHAMNLL